jgi:hypothetical protein
MNPYKLGEDNEGYVNFGEMARNRLGRQCQYTSRYLIGLYPYPDISEGIRWKGSRGDYHSYRIHKDDVEEFIKRIEEYEWDVSRMSKGDLAKKYKLPEDPYNRQ